MLFVWRISFDNLYKDLICVIYMRWSVLILLGVFFISFASAVVPDGCDPSLAVFLKMDGDSTDSSGNGYDGSGDGGVDYTTDLKVDKTARFFGAQSITIAGGAQVKFDSSFTVEMWVEVVDTDIMSSLFDKGDYKIEVIPGGNLVASVGTTQVSFIGIADNVPYHIALVYSFNAQKLLLYVNGVNKNETALDSLLGLDVDDPFVIGNGFSGKIDELAIYTKALIAGDISSHYSVSLGGNDYCSDISAGEVSFAEATFNILGCDFGDAQVAAGECSTYPIDVKGKYFCDVNRRPYKTNEAGLGCARGDTTYDMDSGANFCCEIGKRCNSSLTELGNENLFRCDDRFKTCDHEDFQGNGKETSCKKNGCIWVEDFNKCVETVTEFSCSTYNDSEQQCVNDSMNLGKTGIGTELCGSEMICNGNVRYVIPLENCSCQWFENDKGIPKCQLNLIGIQMFADPDNLGNRDIFSCANAFTLGDCEDGEMDVKWISNNTVVQGFLDDNGQSLDYVPNDCLVAAGCAGGSDVRFCGEPIIKLPGFSLFALFASLFIIGMYYIVNEKHLNKKGD